MAWRRTGSLPPSAGIWALAVIVPLIGWFAPPFMRIVYLGLSYATFPIGFVLSHVILALIYYLVLTPLSLLLRLLGYDFMHRRFEPEAESYWVPVKPLENMERYFRQF